MTRRVLSVTIVWAAALGLVPSAFAQQFLGTFSWQIQPFCDVLVFTVVQQGAVFTLDGYDERCGATIRAPASGVATPNPDGTIALAVTILTVPGANPRYLDVRIDPATLSGTWRLGSLPLETGTFAFGAATGLGPPLPLADTEALVTDYGDEAQFIGMRAEGVPGTLAALGNNQTITSLRAFGHTGVLPQEGARIEIRTTQAWTPTAHGTSILFATTANNAASTSTRMTISADGNVGIGTTAPLERLHVNGAARIGACTYETDGDVTCASDARFKRDVRDLPSMLERLTRLRPVQFGWRAEQFPDRGLPAHESIGLLAQDVEAVLPELVTTDAEGYKAVNYGRLPLLAIQAIKELKAQNDALLEALAKKDAETERRLAALEASLRK